MFDPFGAVVSEHSSLEVIAGASIRRLGVNRPDWMMRYYERAFRDNVETVQVFNDPYSTVHFGLRKGLNPDAVCVRFPNEPIVPASDIRSVIHALLVARRRPKLIGKLR